MKEKLSSCSFCIKRVDLIEYKNKKTVRLLYRENGRKLGFNLPKHSKFALFDFGTLQTLVNGDLEIKNVRDNPWGAEFIYRVNGKVIQTN